MRYYCVHINTDESHHEALIALLGNAGFDMFQEEKDTLNAYIPAEDIDENDLLRILSTLPAELTGANWYIELCPEKNWNEEWENSFPPVLINNRVLVRAPFHAAPPDKDVMDLVIEPKMSFGTGHHPTTELMMTAMLEQDFHGKSVIDMGCGSGILSILALKSGASKVIGIDIDDWAVENALENCQRNNCMSVEVIKGNVHAMKGKKADVLLANINRNILLQDMPAYAELLLPGGVIYMSGFLSEDQPVLLATAKLNGLMPLDSLIKSEWMMLSFKKQL
jgi:ribosomal protein L11 methyltransferase